MVRRDAEHVRRDKLLANSQGLTRSSNGCAEKSVSSRHP